MNQKVAVVTGGSSEIGLAVIKSLLKDGIKVIGQYNTHEIDFKDKDLIPVKCSLENRQDVDSFVKQIFDLKFDIGYLINVAGFIENDSFLKISPDLMQKTFEVNLFSHSFLMQKIFPLMCDNKFGRIVTLSSIGIKFAGSRNSVFYSASKVALEAVTRSFAKFGAEFNVLCNSIRVGVIETNIHKNKDMVERKEKIPLKRFGSTQDIADMVSYLCSEKGNFITGQEIAISGGE